MSTEEQFDFRPIIKRAILLSGLSIPEVAQLAGLRHATVYNYLKGSSDICTRNLVKIMGALKLEVDVQVD